jgi:PAX-interacting protein 1
MLQLYFHNSLISTKGFLPDSDQLFTGIIACLSQTTKADSKALWAMITFSGGQCQLNLNKRCTHLIITKPEGVGVQNLFITKYISNII